MRFSCSAHHKVTLRIETHGPPGPMRSQSFMCPPTQRDCWPDLSSNLVRLHATVAAYTPPHSIILVSMKLPEHLLSVHQVSQLRTMQAKAMQDSDTQRPAHHGQPQTTSAAQLRACDQQPPDSTPDLSPCRPRSTALSDVSTLSHPC